MATLSDVRPPGPRARTARRPGLGRRASLILSCTVVLVLAAAAVGVADYAGVDPFGNARVGNSYAQGILLPTNQWISPLGTRVLDPNARLVSSSLSPDGDEVAALGWNDFSGNLTIFDRNARGQGEIAQQIPLATPAPPNDTDDSVGPDGPLWADNNTLWVPQSTYLLKFTRQPDGQFSTTPAATITLCGNGDPTSVACNANDGAGDPNGSELPAGMTLSPDHSKLYVALNGANKLAVIDTATNEVTSTIPVGNAPRQVVLTNDGRTAWVSNEGGRPAVPGEFTNLTDGTPVVANRKTGAASSGTVSEVDLTTGKEIREIPVGLQPTALYLDQDALFVANSNDDSMSVIDTRSGEVTQTVGTNPVPGASVGSYANAITMLPDNHTLLVSIGRDNAIAVYRYDGLNHPINYEGLIPTDWYPVQVQADPALGGRIIVTNDKGIGARGPDSTIDKSGGGRYPTSPAAGPATGHNTYDDTGSLTVFSMPSLASLKDTTRTVFTDNAWDQIKTINQGRDDTVPSVIPRRIGGGSPIKHVVLIIKENRTYDQVLGDLTDKNGQPEGNGDPALAQFGQKVTPNLHAMAQQFGDFDNFYDEGTLSADGHNWLVQAEANDYVEKEFGAFYRSYPSQAGDALAYQRDGFLWNAARRAGDSVQNFGEYMHNPYTLGSNVPTWSRWYAESQWLENGQKGPEPISNPCQYVYTETDIPSLNVITDHCFPNFQLQIPDQYRVDEWLQKDWPQWQRSGMPDLSFMWLMTDHTAGVGTGTDPAPVAEVADNDLAVGRVIDTISHSRFWRSTAIFVLEDDPQNGVDHVDGHRSVLWVASPYARSGVIDHYYTQVNVVRTIEQILGIHPMNQEDGSAAPMYAAFTSHPSFTPYNVQANQIPLTEGSSAFASQAKVAGRASGAIPAAERGVYEQWVAWSRRQDFNGPMARADRANPAQLNRLDWYSAHNWSVAYPGDPTIYAPDQVPGHNLPASWLGDG